MKVWIILRVNRDLSTSKEIMGIYADKKNAEDALNLLNKACYGEFLLEEHKVA